MNYKIQGKGKPLLLIPGLGGCLKSFDPLMPFLQGFKVIRFDPRGCGESESFTKETEDSLLSEIVSLIKETTTEKINILGNSFGGVLARILGVQNEEIINKVILVATEPDLARVVYEEKTKPSVGKGASPKERTKAWLKSFSSKSWKERDPHGFLKAVAYYSQNEALAETQKIQREFVLSNGREGLPENLRKKTLIIHGDSDPLVPFENAQIMKNLIERSTLEKVSCCGHMVVWEYPELLGKLIGDFVL